jgi:predicted HicB family RNase H-like nuclease
MSEEDKLHLGRCLEFPSFIAHDSSAEVALKEIEKVVEEAIKWLQEENEETPQPFGLKKYKGNLTLRVPVEVHRKLAIKSEEEGGCGLL